MRIWLYAIACLIVPSLWAVTMYWAFGWWQRRLRPADTKQDLPPSDYSI